MQSFVAKISSKIKLSSSKHNWSVIADFVPDLREYKISENYQYAFSAAMAVVCRRKRRFKA